MALMCKGLGEPEYVVVHESNVNVEDQAIPARSWSFLSGIWPPSLSAISRHRGSWCKNVINKFKKLTWGQENKPNRNVLDKDNIP